MNSLIKACVKRPVTVLMIFLALALLGSIAALSLPVDFLPPLQVPSLIVSCTYPGLPPSEVRTLLAIPLEEAFSSLQGITSISSVSRQGSTILELTFQWGTDMALAGVYAREKIDTTYPFLPDDASKPVVLPVRPGERPILWLAVFPRRASMHTARRLCEKEIKTRLQRVPGVGSITIVGGTSEELQVAVDGSQASQLGIPLSSIHRYIQATSICSPAGTLTEGEVEYQVKTEAEIDSIEALSSLLLSPPSGKSPVPLTEIADIQYTSRRQRSLFMADGREGIALLIRRQESASPVKVANLVHAEVARIIETYARDVEMRIVKDSSKIIARSIHTLLFQALLGVGAAFIVLLLFLRNLRLTGILLLIFPVSLLFCLLMLALTSRGLNTMSLGGLTLGVGMLVDNGIVVIENLERNTAALQRRASISPERIADAVSEVALPLFSSTLTTCIVFLPVIFLPGIIGSLYSDLALSVIFSLAGSFLAAVLLLPVLYRLIASPTTFRSTLQKKRKTAHEGPSPISGRTRLQHSRRSLEQIYIRVFTKFLRKPALLLPCVTCLVIAGSCSFFFLDFQLMPHINTGQYDIELRFPPGTSIKRMRAVGDRLFDYLQSSGLASGAYLRAGAEKEDVHFLCNTTKRKASLYMRVECNPHKHIVGKDSIAALEPGLEKQGVSITISRPRELLPSLLGFGSTKTVLQVTGESPQEAHKRARSLAAALATPRGSVSLSVRPREEKQEIHLVPRRDMLSAFGIGLDTVATTVRSALEGSVPGSLTRRGVDTDIRVVLAHSDMRPAIRLGDLVVLSENREPVPLNSVVRIIEKKTSALLVRADRQDAATVLIHHPGEDAARIGNRIQSVCRERSWVSSLSRSVFDEQFSRLCITFGVAVLLLYLVLTAQFESFVTPFILLTTLPLAGCGLLTALAVSGKTINLSSSLGALVLLGIVMNNAIVLFETYRRNRRPPVPPLAAVFKGSIRRFRPILMTMLTTIAALLPVAFDPLQQSNQSGMAAGIIGGLFVSTLLTIIIIPLLYRSATRRERWSEL